MVPEDFNIMIQILLDPSAELGERQDIAIDLRKYPTPKVKQALIEAAKNKNDDDAFLDICGESLAIIWIENGKLDEKNLGLLAPEAYDSAISVIENRRPEWITKYNLKVRIQS